MRRGRGGVGPPRPRRIAQPPTAASHARTAWFPPYGPLKKQPLKLLDGYRGAGAFQGGLGLFRGVLVDLLQDGLGGTVDQVLGLLQAEAGQGAHLLDDLDLLVASGLEDDVELVLLLGLLGGGSGARTA